MIDTRSAPFGRSETQGMSPKIIATSGPLRGTQFELEDAEISVGRAPASHVCVPDVSVSREHCLIKEDAEDGWTVVDRDSANGTFVNDRHVKEHRLRDGDQIAVGQTTLVIFLHPEPEPKASVTLDDADVLADQTIKLREADALYLKPAKADLPATSGVGRDLSTLLNVSRVISSIRSSTQIQRQLVKLILQAVPAERCTLVRLDHGRLDLESAVTCDKRPPSDEPSSLSRRTLERVLQDGSGIVCNDVQTGDMKSSATLVRARVSSVLCVPITAAEEKLGIIYLDTRDPAVRFGEHHLQLLVAIGGIAGVSLQNARHVETLEREAERLRADIAIEHNMVGESPPIRKVYEFVAKTAPNDSTVLLEGESGTGKELVARAIHQNGPRASRPFVAINCAVLSDQLMESDLFGHERGAFTGAITQKRGKLELADKGTLFLDEVAELAPLVQGKLLRVLQEGEFERLGGTRSIKVDIRLVAATNKSLSAAVEDGSFRLDLFYRINVVALTLPSLRQRGEDLRLLATYFLQKCGKRCGRRILGISPEAQSLLDGYGWPGNVRELENAIERAVVMGSTEWLLPEDLPEALVEASPSVSGQRLKYQDGVREAKKQLVLTAVTDADGNITRAAKSLGLHPNYLHQLIRNLGLKQQLMH
ncbi:MAG: sigma-54-dependent Fis family transcriptional regulator [Acidobacteria bacterium]|nr:sigma-54-dependent Fis family transcriptional regulator [Acidobacteriota bacterium]MDP7690260.1 sigma 54-interacting transcriptional regulator [Vicinamibacterales bacterium]HJN46837.1 sigma 54-interacting transcriptional regulator [Vicinamibacterales bacterium]